MAVGFNVSAITFTSTFADDKDCKKNDDNNCNENKKIQKSNAKADCEVDTEIKDHNKNSIAEPIDLQCNSNSQNLIESNIQPSQSEDDDDNGGTSPPPSLTLIPDSGSVGTVVNVFGSNFDPGVQVFITFDGNPIASVSPDTNGNFSADFKAITPILGPHTVTARQSLDSTSATFTVTSGPPFVIIDPTSGPTGTPVNVTGIGYPENSIINILFDGDIISTTPVVVEPNDIGVFSAFITIPPGVIGNHDIAACC